MILDIKYEHILDTKNTIRCKAKTGKLLDTFERVSPLINMETIKSPVKIKIEGDNIIIDCQTLSGKVHDELTVEKISGEDLEIGFNNRYLMEALRYAPADTVKIELNTGVSPAVIVPTEGEENFLYMVLPVRLKAQD